MTSNNIDADVINLVDKLKEKYEANSQDFKAYLEGLLYQTYTNYWDYIEADTLLTLQKPRTALPDELIFIIYHQITELYFKLCLHEMEQIAQHPKLESAFFSERLKRMNAYFRNLTASFEIMVNGMEKEQFLKFRMSLLPASGFQSAQYRMIEIMATDFIRLVAKEQRSQFDTEKSSIEEMFQYAYWKSGATELATGKKTLTLTLFEKKYSDKLIRLAKNYRNKNLWALYLKLPESEKNNQTLIDELKLFDKNVNINWPLVHYKSAVRYLQKDPTDVVATGGTNWQKYLPPRFQQRIFYPDLYTTEELENWGKHLD